MEIYNSYIASLTKVSNSSTNSEYQFPQLDEENPEAVYVTKREEISTTEYDSRNIEMEKLPCEDEPVCPIKVEGETPGEMVSSHFLEPQCALSEVDNVIQDQSTDSDRNMGHGSNNGEYKKQPDDLKIGQIHPANWKHPPTADQLALFLIKQNEYAHRYNFPDAGNFYSQERVEFLIPVKSDNPSNFRLDSTIQQELGDKTLDNSYLEKQKFITELGKKMYQCPECPYTTPLRPNLKVHIMVHTGDKPFKCASCEYKTTTSASLKKHMRIKHTGERPYKCHECEAAFKTNRHLMSHMMMHTGEKPFACSECDYRCSKDVNLRRHILTHTGEKNFQCKECKASFACKRTLSRHMMRHTGETPYTCPICNYSCIQGGTLKKHMLIHTGERPYTCSQCPADFRGRGDLKRHMLVHTDEKPFACDICDHRTNKELNLKRHMLTHTGEKPFECLLCDFKCTENRVLQNHIMVHTGEKPFACPYCEYRCTENRLLKKHVKGHECPYCEYRSAEMKLLRKHKKGHKNADGTFPDRCKLGNVDHISNLPVWPSGLGV